MRESDSLDAEPQPTGGANRMLLALGLLIASAASLSWLGVYAATDALIGAEAIAPFPQSNDPRPRWLVWSFGALFLGGLLLGGAFRYLSRRQLRTIDAMNE